MERKQNKDKIKRIATQLQQLLNISFKIKNQQSKTTLLDYVAKSRLELSELTARNQRININPTTLITSLEALHSQILKVKRGFDQSKGQVQKKQISKVQTKLTSAYQQAVMGLAQRQEKVRQQNMHIYNLQQKILSKDDQIGELHEQIGELNKKVTEGKFEVKQVKHELQILRQRLAQKQKQSSTKQQQDYKQLKQFQKNSKESFKQIERMKDDNYNCQKRITQLLEKEQRYQTIIQQYDIQFHQINQQIKRGNNARDRAKFLEEDNLEMRMTIDGLRDQLLYMQKQRQNVLMKAQQCKQDLQQQKAYTKQIRLQCQNLQLAFKQNKSQLLQSHNNQVVHYQQKLKKKQEEIQMLVNKDDQYKRKIKEKNMQIEQYEKHIDKKREEMSKYQGREREIEELKRQLHKLQNKSKQNELKGRQFQSKYQQSKKDLLSKQYQIQKLKLQYCECKQLQQKLSLKAGPIQEKCITQQTYIKQLQYILEDYKTQILNNGIKYDQIVIANKDIIMEVEEWRNRFSNIQKRLLDVQRIKEKYKNKYLNVRNGYERICMQMARKQQKHHEQIYFQRTRHSQQLQITRKSLQKTSKQKVMCDIKKVIDQFR